MAWPETTTERIRGPTANGVIAMVARCGSHAWRTPTVGDKALVCDVCETRLDLARDIAPEVQAEILRDYRRDYGPIVSRHFEDALKAAVVAAQRHAGTDRSEAAVKEGA